MNTSQALASLTAMYTDSEEDEDIEDGPTFPDKSHTPSPAPLSLISSPLMQSLTELTSGISPVIAHPQPLKRLVSYNDDTVISDEEPSVNVPEKIDLIEIDKPPEPVRQPAIITDDGITIPPDPPGKCSEELQEKISLLYQKMINEGTDMNKVIQDRKSFRNPSIYEKLIQFCGINESDTNYPPDVYDPLRWGKESYYDELAKVQKIEMDEREKDRKEKLAKIDFTTGFIKKVDGGEDSKKRKSKWDQAAPNSSAVKQHIKPAGLVQPALTATGTKRTVILAYGSLSKKPKV